MNEAWEAYYSEEEIKKIQQIELRSLDVLCEICNQLEIQAFLYGGSLLGAVKYGGFIPWDDDLDMAMLRDDYEKFIREGPKLLPADYEIQHPKTNKKTPYNYIKFRRTDTILVEYKNHKIKMNHGVYFDIYPIDNLPDDYAAYMQQKLAYDKWVNIFLVRQNFRLGEKTATWKQVLRLSIRFCQSAIARLIPLRYIMGKIDKISTRYNCQITINQGNLTYPKPVNFFNGVSFVQTQFENRIAYIPSGYRINLLNRYGDINREPPEDKRVGHRPFLLDLGDEK